MNGLIIYYLINRIKFIRKGLKKDKQIVPFILAPFPLYLSLNGIVFLKK